MNQLQSKINAVEARIKQIEDSELFSDTERVKILPGLKLELEQLQLEKADEILNMEVIKPSFPGTLMEDSTLKNLWDAKGRDLNNITF